VNTSKRRIFAGAIALTLVAAACGSDDDSSGTEPAGSEAPAASEVPAEGTAPADGSEPDDSSAPDDSSLSADGGSVSGSIAVSGSSTVEPISAAVGAAFSDMNPDVAITVDGPGTGDGFAQFCAGEIDIADASRAIKADEAETCDAAGIEFIELKVAVDGLSVVTSAEDEAVTCLSFVDLYALLGPDATGINNWSDASAAADEIATTVTDLGAVNTPYPDADLTVTAPGEESGTFDSFVELVITPVGEALGVEEANVRPDYTASPNDNVIIEGIAANPSSLGWVGFAFVEENLDVIKPLQVDGGDGCVEPTAETIASGEYPIARDLFIYVSVPALEANPALAPFVEFYLGEGVTTLVGPEEGQVPYVQLSDEDLAAQVAAWDAQETGTREG